ncbi:tRNA pseudouridine(55) synthase TruB [Marinicella sp. W31]|uniref:tRNA pseudouridine(55) synthase TruB n=1 Tax=Marinicella sp. W31 TaxID=3023713 RepID=UPI003756B972
MSRPPKQDIHGVLLLDKPADISSNNALQKVKHLFSARKAGHTGNLDPMATGLLPCCFGDATKVAHFLINSDKTYIAECCFGSQTDTGDATGTVVKTCEKTRVAETELSQVLADMHGPQQQIPPMYSALHHEGKRLYQLAREGKTVERPPRDITVHQFQLLGIEADTARFEIQVSKGTYIRTLLEDMAAACGTLAHMTELRRIRTGIFDGADMLTIEQIEAAEDPQEFLLPADAALREYPELRLDAALTQDILHGKKIPTQMAPGIVRMYDPTGLFLGLGTVQEGLLKVLRLFYKSYEQSRSQQ